MEITITDQSLFKILLPYCLSIFTLIKQIFEIVVRIIRTIKSDICFLSKKHPKVQSIWNSLPFTYIKFIWIYSFSNIISSTQSVSLLKFLAVYLRFSRERNLVVFLLKPFHNCQTVVWSKLTACDMSYKKSLEAYANLPVLQSSHYTKLILFFRSHHVTYHPVLTRLLQIVHYSLSPVTVRVLFEEELK